MAVSRWVVEVCTTDVVKLIWREGGRECSNRCFDFGVGHISYAFAHCPVWLIFQLEEVRGIPASSEKAISEATARKDELEQQKVKEEEKLKDVMESLKEETSGLQQDKEVGVYIMVLVVCSLKLCFVLFCF